jgi:hypothetical protein
MKPGDFVRVVVPRIPPLIPSSLQPGDLYIMDLRDTHTQVITTETGYPVGYTYHGEVCLVLQIEPNHVQFLTSQGIPGWIHRDWFYSPEIPGD